MKVSQIELFGAAAILLYIVFFSHSPPAALRSLLSNTVVSVLVLAVLAYVTMCQSRTIGVLAILAFLLTMTRVTEHLESAPATSSSGTPAGPSPPTNTPPPPPPPVSTHMDASGNIVDTSGNVVTPAHTDYSPTAALQSSPGVTAAATSSPAPNTPASQLVEGKSYKCDTSGAIYGFVSGTLRLYPTPEIAASWDPSWASAQLVDCTNVPKGSQLDAKPVATAPAAPPPATAPPAPVMSCNIESFASF
jgi:hypothetical protein